MGRTDDLLHALAVYRVARLTLLRTLGIEASNRDPLAEFAEQFVAAITEGQMASNRVQRGWDLTLPDGSQVQVKYLANTTADRWVNEHLITRIPEVDWYALVIIENFTVTGVVMFPCNALAPVAAALGKRHGNTETTLQFTRRNWLSTRRRPRPLHGPWRPGVPPTVRRITLSVDPRRRRVHRGHERPACP